jgi:5'-3' exonuclease
VAKNTHQTDADFLGVYIFLTSLKSYYEKYQPTHIICCWDEKLEYKPNPRKQLLEQYKGNRDKDNNVDIHADNQHIKDLIESIGGINFFPRELEADDIMAFLCHNIPGKKVIITVDKDLLQLVDSDTVVYSPIKKVEYNIDNIDELLGYSHKNFVIYKAFIGDQSDNIPGVYRFGPKKIEQYINGSIALTEDQQKIVDLNMSLMDLNQGYVQYPEEKQYYQDQMKKEFPKPDWDRFMFICKDLNFQKVVNQKEKWFETFFQKDVMNNIISNLFA